MVALLYPIQQPWCALWLRCAALTALRSPNGVVRDVRYTQMAHNSMPTTPCTLAGFMLVLLTANIRSVAAPKSVSITTATVPQLGHSSLPSDSDNVPSVNGRILPASGVTMNTTP